MLQYNGSSYIRPYSGNIRTLNDKQQKPQLSTASISSNRSQSNQSIKSISKYSFKTGCIKNIYTKRQEKQPNIFVPLIYTSVQTMHTKNKDPNPYFSKQNSYIHNNAQTYKAQKHKIKNNSFQYFKPISDPPINKYILKEYQSSVKQYTLFHEYDENDKRRQQIQARNISLRKAISEKKIRLEKHFISLQSKIGLLKREFVVQEQKMSKISLVVNKYFSRQVAEKKR